MASGLAQMFHICSIYAMTCPPPRDRPRGRGAQSGDVSQRFGLPEREQDGDWLDMREQVDGPANKLRTTVTLEAARRILTRNTSPDVLLLLRAAHSERTMCEHKASNAEAVAPLFSPDSQRIYFQSDRHGKPAIYSMHVEKLVEKTEAN